MLGSSVAEIDRCNVIETKHPLNLVLEFRIQLLASRRTILRRRFPIGVKVEWIDGQQRDPRAPITNR
jgi:hypothetical protein